MSADEFDHAAADDGLETREKGERPRWLHEWLPAHMNDGVRYCSKCGYAEGSLPDCPMSVDRGTPTPPPTVTGQSPNSEVFVVSDEAVETAMEEWIARTTCKTESLDSLMRAVLVAALPVIERDLRETIAGELEADPVAEKYEYTVHRLAARVREGGGDEAMSEPNPLDRPVRVQNWDGLTPAEVIPSDVLDALDDDAARAAYLALADRVACPGCCNCQPANYDDPRCNGDGMRAICGGRDA